MPFATGVLYANQTTTVRVVRTTPSILAGYYAYNPNAAVAYVQLFDLDTTVTLGTTTPYLSLGIPPACAANLLDTYGITFRKGLQMACTTTATGNTAPATGLDVNLFFQESWKT